MQMGRVKEFVATHLASDVPLERLLLLFALTITEEFQASPAIFQCLFTAILSNQGVQGRMVVGLETARQVLARLLADRQQKGKIRGELVPTEVASSFQGMVLGTTLVWSLAPARPLEEKLTRAVQAFVGGIASRPSGGGAS